MKKLLFMVNPKAGKTTIKNKFYEIIEILSEADYEVTVHPTRSSNDARDFVMNYGDEFDIIVAAGGDGTLDNVVTGMIMSDCETPLGYIPCGTTNDFARSLEIPRDPVMATTSIVEGNPYAVDVGSFNGDYFIYVAAFGAFTEVSYSTPQVYKNYFGHTAYILEGIKSLGTIKGYDLTVTYDGEQTITGNYMYGMVTNSLSVGGFKSLSKYVEFDDGLFEVLLIKTANSPSDLQAIMSALLLNEINEDYMVSLKTRDITITCDNQEVAWALDGEDGGVCKQAHIVNHQKALKIMIKE